MHKILFNEATFQLTIAASGPLLVKSGLETWDPTTPDMEFIRTWDARLGEDTVFIPGSSLKGTLRSYSEKIVRTLDLFCCDPFDNGENSPTVSCGAFLKKISEKNDTPEIYQQSCPACKIYGSTTLAGRAAFKDAHLTGNKEIKLSKRTAVAIDRVLGSVAVGPFDFEALVSGELTTEIRMRNFELWQLGLLGLAVRDLCHGRVRIGYGKSRGFGNVSAKLTRLELRSIVEGGLASEGGKLLVKSAGAGLSATDLDKYGINPAETRPADIVTNITPKDEMLGKSVSFEAKGDQWCAPEAEMLFSKCVDEHWRAYRDSSRKGDRRWLRG